MGVAVGVASSDLVNHHEHDGFGDGVTDSFANNGEVGIHEVSDRLYLSLQLWVNGVILALGTEREK